MTILKVDFGDFQFLRIEPRVVRFVSGVATALLGSGGLCTNLCLHISSCQQPPKTLTHQEKEKIKCKRKSQISQQKT